MILYEYPCNERVRTFLRVESLFKRLFYFTEGADSYMHQVAIATLFDLLDVTERSDLRGMVLQDLERQRAALAALREHPQVSADMLDKMLAEIHDISSALASQGRSGQELRNNEWLSSLRGRLVVPGGYSPVDMPSFYGWQMQSVAKRQSDIAGWSACFMPLFNALSLILRILRGAGDTTEQVATDGSYQEMLGGKSFQLLRVWVNEKYEVFPEMSANKYVILVRFSRHDGEQKPLTVKENISFTIARCNVG
ncbi:MAG TPA: cell division protein ZapD [Paenalcaligenes hominis]|uniref:Cell division protein ZapD n=1 Tax=Paenalcaligenes hominis TaxID=643674 RepID=A0A9D2VHW4_9BURK|nr:cell division protein ZapD [Paenalcaligenes hominis]NJB65596.1 cell division protein ZapD [Paenalcaligenes hominis]GGE64507.1 cell division protein ZapD [Paenalcaligenes hominis]HJH25153.1 cell division protein ZapD [Paenalcaligenes hominis]